MLNKGLFVLFFLFSISTTAAPVIEIPLVDHIYLYSGNMSGDGEYYATNLRIEGSQYETYLYNISNGQSQLILEDTSSQWSLQLSHNGEILAFLSRTQKFAPGNVDTQAHYYERVSNQFSIIKNEAQEIINDDIRSIKLSDNGQFIYFTTEATNVVTGFESKLERVYKYEIATESLSVVVDEDVYQYDIDANGNFIAYSSSSSSQLILKNLNTSAVQTYDYTEDLQFAPYQLKLLNSNEIAFRGVSKESESSLFVYSFLNQTSSSISLANEFPEMTFDRWSSDTVDGRYWFLKGRSNGTPFYYNHLWRVDFSAKELRLVSFNALLEKQIPKFFVNAFDRSKILFESDNPHIPIVVNVPELEQMFDVPDPVANLQVSDHFPGRIELTWQSSGTYFQVYRYSMSDPSDVEFLATIDEMSYQDSRGELEVDTLYGYQVRACNQIMACRSDAQSVENGMMITPPKIIDLNQNESLKDTRHRLLSWSSIPLAYYNYKKDGDRGEIEGSFSVDDTSGKTLVEVYRHNFISESISIRACVFSVCGPYSDPLELLPYMVENIHDIGHNVDDSYSAITLSWSVDNMPDHFLVERRLSPEDEYQEWGRTDIPSYVDNNLGPQGQAHYYRIKACNVNGVCNSVLEDREYQASFVAPESALPKPGLNVHRYANYYSISNPNAEYFERIEVFRRSERFGTGLSIANIDNRFSEEIVFNDRDITEATHYFYYIVACVNDYCQRSNDVAVDPMSESFFKMLPIVDLSATQGSFANQIHLTWSHDGVASSFGVYRSSLGTNNWSRIAWVSGSKSEYFDRSVSEGGRYKYYLEPNVDPLATTGSTHRGFQSNIALGNVTAQAENEWTPAVPAIETVQGQYSDRIYMQWEVESGVRYYLYASDLANGEFELLRSRLISNFTERSLDPGVTRYYKLQACNGDYCSELGIVTSGSTGDAQTAPLLPPVITSISLNSADVLTMTHSSRADATFYRIEYSRESDFSSSPSYDKSETTHSKVLYPNSTALYFRVRACNIAGCSDPSDTETVTFAQTMERRDQYYLNSYKELASGFELTIGYKRGLFNNYQQGKLYVSEDGGAPNQLAILDPNVDTSVTYEFSNAEPGKQYKFWIENCDAIGCWTSSEYLMLLVEPPPGIPPIPSNFSVSQRMDTDRFDYYSNWQPRGVEIEFYVSDTLEGQPNFVDEIGPSETLWRYATIGDFEPTLQYVWARSCYQELCSDMTEAKIASTSPQFVSSIELQPGSLLWNEPSSLIEGKVGLTGDDEFRTEQKLFVEKGFEFSTRINLWLNWRSYCSDELSLFLFEHGFIQVPLLKVVTGDANCANELMTDHTKLYFQIGDDEEPVAVIEREPLNKRWTDLHINVSENGVLTVYIDGQQIARKIVPSFNIANFNFIRFGINTYFGNNAFTDITLESLQEFDKNRPVIKGSSPFNDDTRFKPEYRYSLRDKEPSNSTQFDYYFVDEGQLTKIKSEHVSDTQSTVVTPAEFYHYVVARECNQNLCSPSEYHIQQTSFADELPQADVLAVSQNTAESLELEWSTETHATSYRVYLGNELDQMTMYGSVSSTSFTVTEYDVNDQYAAVVSCSDDMCGELYKLHNVARQLDTDGDGLNNWDELNVHFSDPTLSDTDGDGVSDRDEIEDLGTDPNRANADTDGDGIFDELDPDDDNDGVNDEQDAFPLDASESADFDGDGIGNNADLDDDNDGLADTIEISIGSNPFLADTDGDLKLDGEEYYGNDNPLVFSPCPGPLCGSSFWLFRLATR